MGVKDAANINALWSTLLVEECVRNSVDFFCISPGSRSTPLTVAAARHPRVKTTICHDERGAAFHALGYARATGRPAALICTSGTAVANAFPAVIEAAMDRLPLLILSADRPPELLESGANQTIRQAYLFGDYAQWFFELPCPDESISPKLVLTTIDQAVHRTRGLPPGPVHLNCLFREPLAPAPKRFSASYGADLNSWRDAAEPLTRYEIPVRTPSSEALEKIRAMLAATEQGIVVVGRLHSDGEREAVLELSRSLQWPVWVDISSGLRLGGHGGPIVHYFDQLLLSATFRDRYRPDTVLHIGGEIISKRFLEFMEKSPPLNYLAIKDHPFRHDPLHQVSHRLEADIETACHALAEQVSRRALVPWVEAMTQRSATVHEMISHSILPGQPVDEISVARLVSEHIPGNHGLWLGNSMPVRDMDMFGNPDAGPARIGLNRGASGIDGTLASATGFAAGLQKPVTLILGDVSMLHDLNSLLLVKRCPQPIIVIVVNNDGGGIFSFLPITDFGDVFEDFFGTPHHLSYRAAAELFSIDYVNPKINEEFVQHYRAALQAGQPAIIEITTDRRDNYRLHRALQRAIEARLENDFSEI